MDEWLAPLTAAAHAVQAWPLLAGVGQAALIYSGFFLVVLVAERRAGADVRRYWSRNFANDVAYTLFYKGGIFNVVLLAATTNALELHLGAIRLGLMKDLAWPVGLAVFWVGGDFAMYWWHRLQHANRFLWALHSVHHSQTQLNLFTAWRRHPLENLILTVLIFFGFFHLVLGVPTRGWMPLAAAITSLTAIQHAQLDWRFGILHRVVVSPRFHAFHHSTDPAHANANYGFLFSAWDYLFGTAVAEQPRPRRFGIVGIDFHESLLEQLVTPFRLAWRWRHAAPAPVEEAGSIAAGSSACRDA
jgi:sterol desaturase/sphingolipid hydroxylase (fatty acid hydroxylase superfamily)